MKNIFFLFAFIIVGTFVVFPAYAISGLDGKVIGLDAGHGNGATGAVGYCGGIPVLESDVNFAVRAELTTLIESNTAAETYHIAQLSSRKARVEDAETNGSDILISIHHNGSSDTTVDYTQSFVTQKNDRDLAKPIHAELTAIFGPDKGIKNDGYGMTVYGSLPGVLTESYFITNEQNACEYLAYMSGHSDTRIQQEAQAMFSGLINYFSASDGGGNNSGGKPDKCSPWPSCKNN